MQPMGIPPFTDREVDEYLERARQSGRKRAPKILHEPGAEMNRVVNVLLRGTYMQPHCHTQPDAVERIHVMRGELVIVFFDEHGHIDRTVALAADQAIDVPVGAWHTYLVTSEFAVTYETMTGVYDPLTWKAFGRWAPSENAPGAPAYLRGLADVVGRA